ncbi:excinuclease ABC subunit A [Enterococcus silesiacus]|uniref:DNA polymerase V n=1 Tax=Enterococcus silesiacus TaxID=332949 RepID=A0A0S3K796_9ENTE|nr:Y-family DNA polymerase [Enterococcus silesiacus]ALS00172.1 excinuclease ABC subunit A [Enterococcus silesiacus]OJG93145.1 DNA polymerase V [Enterococcus silesiacus]
MIFDYKKEPRRVLFCIDVKSFYASVECVARGYDPLEKMLVVMSHAENTGGLVLASSPKAKEVLGITNVTRKYDVPNHPDLMIVPPRMNEYIKENMKINELYKEYVAEEDLHIYSIDESFLDVSASWKLFGQTPRAVAKIIQQRIKKETGLAITVGIGDNPLLAKLAMDIEAKHNEERLAEWHYEDVPEKVWRIESMTDMWGIGHRLAKRLNNLAIRSVYDLAHADINSLKRNLGIIGEQLYAHAHGIDRSRLSEKYIPEERSYNNSQILMRDYLRQDEIEVVIREMAEQVAARLRKAHCQTECVHLSVGFSKAGSSGGFGFSRQMKVPLTNSSKLLIEYCLTIFRQHWHGEEVRHIGITYSKLNYNTYVQLDLFHEPDEQMKELKLDQLIDEIRQRFGYVSLVHASSVSSGGTAISRASLVGGHAGGMEGLQ